jgi:hypothetical protein
MGYFQPRHKFKNPVANSIPRQISKTLRVADAENLVSFEMHIADPDNGNQVTTCIITHGDETEQKFHWTTNPDPDYVDRFPNAWVEVNAVQPEPKAKLKKATKAKAKAKEADDNKVAEEAA